MMKRLLVLAICGSMLVSGCAGVTSERAARTAPPRDAALMASYVRNIPVGSPVRVGLADGRTLSGTLMRADDGSIVVQPKGRVPEAPVALPIGDVVSVDIQRPSGIGKVIAIGAAAGAAATFGVILILYAALGDD